MKPRFLFLFQVSLQGIHGLELFHECHLNYTAVPFTKIYDIARQYGETSKYLGSGTASVSLMHRHEDNRPIAVKTYPRDTSKVQDDVEARRSRERQDNYIKLEYYINIQLSKLEGVGRSVELLLESSPEQPEFQQWHLAMDYHPRTLRFEVETADRDALSQLFIQIMEAVAQVHDRGIAHGDIKIDNILLTEDGTVKLIDWGSATFLGCPVETPDADANVTPGDFGTVAYLPPEIYTVLEYDRQRADIWALGVLFVTMMDRGYLPWQASSVQDRDFRRFIGHGLESNRECAVVDEVASVFGRFEVCNAGRNEVLQCLPEEWRGIISEMLELDPLKRPLLTPTGY